MITDPLVNVAYATIFFQSEMMGHVIKREVRELIIIEKGYAQYPRALHVGFIPKGSRKRRGLIITPGDPFLMVLTGWKHAIEPDPMYDQAAAKTTGIGRDQVTTVSSRYASFDPRWVADFRLKLAAAVAPGDLIFDAAMTPLQDNLPMEDVRCRRR